MSPDRQFDIRTYRELLDEYQQERGTEAPDPIRMGFGTIDADYRGLRKGQVLGIAARTSVGKTWILTSVQHNISALGDTGVLALTLEMPGLEWAERSLAIYEDVAPERVEQWAKTGELHENSERFLRRMQNVVVCEQSVWLRKIPAVCDAARERLNVPLRCLLIDYAGLIGSKERSAYERASEVARGLKLIAKAVGVSVFVAMQISRAGGNGGEPVELDMIRDSGSWEESLDVMLGAWRPGKDAKLNAVEQYALRDIMRVRLLKNRNGPEGRETDLTFRPDSRKLVEEADVFAG